jgi:hypothetical protein
MRKSCCKEPSIPALSTLGRWALLTALLVPPMAKAEYRVFLLRIQNIQSKEVRTLESTLDPIQYPYYNTVSPDERVSYAETWRCFGRTGGFAPFCPNPKAQPPPETPTTPP